MKVTRPASNRRAHHSPEYPAGVDAMTDTLKCLSCARMLPVESFRYDTRCAKRDRRSYSCLECEAGEQLSFAARRVERKAAPKPARSIGDLVVGHYVRRDDVLFVVTRHDRLGGVVWAQQVSPPRPLSGELAISPGNLDQFQLLEPTR